MTESLLSRVLPITSMFVMGALLLIYLPRYFARPAPAGPAPEPLPLRPLLQRVFALLALSRAFLFLAALVMANLGGEGEFFANPLGSWIRWDANHYLGLAENWYQNQGDPRFHIVFYPLYPLLVRGLRLLFLCNTVLAAFLVSNACLFLSGWALYRLVEAEQGQRAGRRALRYLMLCPLSLFCSIPYSESLFLALTLSSVLMARRRRMALAIALGALASATRLLGLLCAVPVFLEFLHIARGRSNEQPGRFAPELLKGIMLTSLIALGFVCYLLLNKRVTGDPFTFLTYQREHWEQTFGSLYGSVHNTLKRLFDTGDWGNVLGIWLPQLMSMFLVLLVMCATAKTLHPGDSAYALLYFYVALSPTWLLSGPRYLMAMYPLYPMLALVTGKKWQDALMTALLILMSAYCVYAYAILGTLL